MVCKRATDGATEKRNRPQRIGVHAGGGCQWEGTRRELLIAGPDTPNASHDLFKELNRSCEYDVTLLSDLTQYNLKLNFELRSREH
jgi:hypothetical protein